MSQNMSFQSLVVDWVYSLRKFWRNFMAWSYALLASVRLIFHWLWCLNTQIRTTKLCFDKSISLDRKHILECYELFRYCMKVGACHEVELDFFAKNMPDPLHWTQNSYFERFRTILLLNESWCKTSRTGAINTQVHATSCVGVFAPNAPHSLHCTQNSCFGGVPTIFVTALNLFKMDWTGAINAQVQAWSCIIIFLEQRHAIHYIGHKTNILGHFEPFLVAPKLVQNETNWCH